MTNRKVKCPICDLVQKALISEHQTVYRCKNSECKKLVRAMDHVDAPKLLEEPKMHLEESLKKPRKSKKKK